MSSLYAPIRVMHVVGGMDRGGVETWLMHVLRHIDRDRFHFDFLVPSARPYDYNDEIRALGARVLVAEHPHRPHIFAGNLRRVIRQYGKPDILHTHSHYYAGFVLWLARLLHIPVRIAHSHTDLRAQTAQAALPRRLYAALTQRLVQGHAMLGLADSERAACSLYGPDWQQDDRWRIAYTGIDLTPFAQPVNPPAVRAELGLPPDAFVLGHVGRFVPVKNHAFLLQILAALLPQHPTAYLLLVGTGPLQSQVQQQARQLGLADRVVFAGVRPDVPRLMLGAMDAFVMPSLYEGLPLVGIEAQAAGLPLLLSDAVTREIGIVEGLVRWQSLEQPPAAWARALLPLAPNANHADGASYAVPSRKTARAQVEASHFNIEGNVKDLSDVYLGSVTAAGLHYPAIA